MSLLLYGTQKDKFEPEIQKICAKLKPTNSIDEISGIMTDVFNSAYEANDSSDKCKKYTEKVF